MGNKKNISDYSNKFRNYIPFFAIFVLTAGLLFYFKENKQSVNEFIETGKDNLISFYTQNLKPLLFKTDITNEDVFNFALYQNLPIDKKENKVLQIGYDETTGNEFFEIKPADINENTNNYEKFVDYLQLTKTQRSQLDSILNSYKDALYTSVLYNDKNTIAVDSKVSLLRDAALADLMSFAQNVRGTNENVINVSSKYNTEEIRKAISEIKTAGEKDLNDYVIFTPDSIFKTEFEINKKKLNDEMITMKWDLEKVRSEMKDMKMDIKVNPITDEDKVNEKGNWIKPDSNYYKTFVSKDFMMKRMKSLPDVEKLRADIEKLTANIKVKVKADLKKEMQFDFKTMFNGDSNTAFTFDLNLNGLDTLIQNSVKGFSEKDIKDWEEFGQKMDSLANSFEFNFNDSSFKKFDKQKLRDEIRKAKREIKKTEKNKK